MDINETEENEKWIAVGVSFVIGFILLTFSFDPFDSITFLLGSIFLILSILSFKFPRISSVLLQFFKNINKNTQAKKSKNQKINIQSQRQNKVKKGFQAGKNITFNEITNNYGNKKRK